MGQLVCVERPGLDVVTVDLAKQYAHIDTSADDLRVRALILAATQRLDGAAGILGRALAQQTWRVELADWPAGGIELPLPPLVSVDAVDYLDGAGVRQTLDPSSYRAIDRGDNRGAVVVPAIGASYPSALSGQPDSVRVTFTCGYLTDASPTTDVPEPLRLAILLMVDEWYNRGDQQADPNLSPTVNNLIYTYKVGKFGYQQHRESDGVTDPDALLFEFTRL